MVTAIVLHIVVTRPYFPACPLVGRSSCLALSLSTFSHLLVGPTPTRSRSRAPLRGAALRPSLGLRALSLGPFKSLPHQRRDERDLAVDLDVAADDDGAGDEAAGEVEDGQRRTRRVDPRISRRRTARAIACSRRRVCRSTIAWNSDARGFTLVIWREMAATYIRKKSRCSKRYCARAVTNAGIVGMQVGCPVKGVASAFVQLGQATAERGIVDVLFRRVIQIGRALRDPGFLCDLFHGRAVEAVFAEHPDGRLQQRVTAVLGDDVGLGGLLMTVHSDK